MMSGGAELFMVPETRNRRDLSGFPPTAMLAVDPED